MKANAYTSLLIIHSRWTLVYGIVADLRIDTLTHEVTTIAVETEEINIGEVYPRTTHKAQYNIHNTGEYTLRIDTILTSCGCITATFDKQNTKPKEHVTITLTYTAEEFSGEFFRTAEIECNTEVPIILILSGLITQKIE